MTRILTLEIKRCIDCPYHQELSDPGSPDSFDAMDTSIVCTKAKLRRASLDRSINPKGYRYVSISERPWRHAKAPIPDWCPLPREEQ